jgi:hypothetical protein
MAVSVLAVALAAIAEAAGGLGWLYEVPLVIGVVALFVSVGFGITFLAILLILVVEGYGRYTWAAWRSGRRR